MAFCKFPEILMDGFDLIDGVTLYTTHISATELARTGFYLLQFRIYECEFGVPWVSGTDEESNALIEMAGY